MALIYVSMWILYFLYPVSCDIEVKAGVRQIDPRTM